jgi:hypothetical protein
MLTTSWIILLSIAALIVIALAFYAGKLLKQLNEQKKAQEQAEIKHQIALRKHDKKVLDSVVIIVRAMKEEQCDISEGCWRLSVLLDSLKISQDLSSEFPAIFELYRAIKHMPILEERKKLVKQERMKLDFQRAKIESELASKIQTDIELLHQYSNERISVLNS